MHLMCLEKGQERSLQPGDLEGNCHFLLLSDNFVNSRCDSNNWKSKLAGGGGVVLVMGKGLRQKELHKLSYKNFGQEFSIAATLYFYRAIVTSSGCGGNVHSRTLWLCIHY